MLNPTWSRDPIGVGPEMSGFGSLVVTADGKEWLRARSADWPGLRRQLRERAIAEPARVEVWLLCENGAELLERMTG